MISFRSVLAAATTLTLCTALQAAEPVFHLPALPYAPEALAPHIDVETMRIHHGRHHQAYVNNLNAEVAKDARLADLELEQIQRRISEFSAAVRNNAGGHYNHALFWTLMAPAGEGGEPSAALAARIKQDFGDMDSMQREFNQAATRVFGSGWAWLSLNADGRLQISSTANQDNPLMDVIEPRGAPVLALDVWEHAYYLSYQNRRPDYISAWWNLVNWHTVNDLYAAAIKAQGGRTSTPAD